MVEVWYGGVGSQDFDVSAMEKFTETGKKCPTGFVNLANIIFFNCFFSFRLEIRCRSRAILELLLHMIIWTTMFSPLLKSHLTEKSNYTIRNLRLPCFASFFFFIRVIQFGSNSTLLTVYKWAFDSLGSYF